MKSDMVNTDSGKTGPAEEVLPGHLLGERAPTTFHREPAHPEDAQRLAQVFGITLAVNLAANQLRRLGITMPCTQVRDHERAPSEWSSRIPKRVGGIRRRRE